MTNTTTWKANLAPALLASFALLLVAGCGGKDSGGNRSPIFNTGVNASVIEPGGALPTMPPPVVGRSTAPGNYNQSSRGGAQNATPSESASQGGARILPPGGYPPQGSGGYPGAAPAGGGGMVSIGGATTIDTRSEKREMKPLDAMSRNPLLWPVAAVAWPFQKIAQSAKGSANRSHSGGPQSVPPPLTAEEVDQLHDREQTLAMERALASQRDGASAARPAPRQTRPAPSRGETSPATTRSPSGWQGESAGGVGTAPSIADELAALRRGLGGAASPPAPQMASRRDATRMRDVPADPYPGETPDGDRYRQRFDDNGDGQPDREEVYDDEGLIAESSEDANSDGRIDTWTRYRNGAPVRRRADVDGDGMVDAWTYYEAGGLEVARLERDTDADGYRDQIDFFDNGRLARRTEDSNGDGFPERVTRFGDDGRPAERDEDSDGDGAMDTRSFYEAGRLTRRLLLNEDERWEP